MMIRKGCQRAALFLGESDGNRKEKSISEGER